MPQRSRTAAVAEVFHFLTLLPLILLSILLFLSLGAFHTPVGAATGQQPPAPTTPAPAPPTPDQIKAQDARFETALKDFKDRADLQQKLIATLTTLTSLYVVILSFAAYFRLQQTRDESREAVARNEKGFQDTRKYYEDRFGEIKERISDLATTTRAEVTGLQRDSRSKVTELIAEVRTDVPALHGIGRRLEKLLAELDSRLPVDGDWTNADTYKNLTTDDKEQAYIDEMVINSLDIFNVTEDLGARRTVARLYVRLGQFYFSRANFLKTTIKEQIKAKMQPTITPDEPWNSLCRGGLYLEKAVRTDETDAVALRARGVIIMHNAIWKKEKENTPEHDRNLLADSRRYIDKSLKNNPTEPGALFARAWLLVRENPPDYDSAIKDLTGIIARAKELSTLHRRKFLDICYLNRASYNARVLRHSTPTPEEKAAALKSITEDIQEGMKTAKAAHKDGTYAGEIRREIDKGGDLEQVYPEIKSTVDSLLTT